MLSVSEYCASLAKIFGRGPVLRYPKIARDRTVFLACATASLAQGQQYSETEINGTLGSWLKSKDALEAIDHVTLRRYLIDTGFLGRAKNGADYNVISSALALAIEPDALRLRVEDVLRNSEEERLERKKAWEAQKD